MSFSYEKLPNFCYWCGMVCYNDKDCDIWLSSKGSLSIKSQEFGAWLRASPFNLGRKTFCSVPGLEVFPVKGLYQEHHEEGPSATPPLPPPSSITHEENTPMDTVLNLESTDLVENPLPSWPSSNLGPKLGKHNEAVSPTPHTKNTYFEFQIHEIDMAIHKFDGVIGANQDTTNQ